MMDSDEREVYSFLKGQENQLVSAVSICRHAGGKHKFRDNPDWAKPVLVRMQDRGILETDGSNSYRLRPIPAGRTMPKRWVSPQIAAILKQSGRRFGDTVQSDDKDAYYESL